MGWNKQWKTILRSSSKFQIRIGTEQVTRRVTMDQNTMLLAEVSVKEVKTALFNMHPDKFPGLNGMSSGFYQLCWPVVKRDVVSIV